jgi:hypothetical protein
MAQFRDTTGRPGPSTWIAGHYPERAADFSGDERIAHGHGPRHHDLDPAHQHPRSEYCPGRWRRDGLAATFGNESTGAALAGGALMRFLPLDPTLSQLAERRSGLSILWTTHMADKQRVSTSHVDLRQCTQRVWLRPRPEVPHGHSSLKRMGVHSMGP